MKTHISLMTRDLAKSTAFYATLLDAAPAKRLEDYVLFLQDSPGLELALNKSDRTTASADMHFGISVETASDVDKAIQRLQAANLVDSVEREENCCYANQTKVWTRDPDGRRWEIYTVHAELEETAPCCGVT